MNTIAGPTIAVEGINLLEIDGIKTLASHTDFPVIQLKEVEDVFIHKSFPALGTNVFVDADG